MPTDFWRNDQMLNIFRTKPCQRLQRDGLCGWKSQCQFSHCLEWPRRQPRRYNYSPELCPYVCLGDGGRVENKCNAGLRCPWAHSKEEVLFHPSIFKTSLCEDYTANSAKDGQKQTRNGKKSKSCHRYYCPLAHGADELRPSPLNAEQRENCLRAMELFPSDVCCSACTCPWVTPAAGNVANANPPPASSAANDNEETYRDVEAIGFDAQAPGLLQWSQKPPPHLWDMLATVPNPVTSHSLQELGLKPAKGTFAAPLPEKPAHDPDAMCLPIQKPFKDPSAAPYSKPDGDLQRSLFTHGEPLASMRVSSLSNDSPAFIDFALDGLSIGQKQPPKSPQPRDYLGELYYAML